MNAKNENYTIISDPGVDDMIALLLLLRLSPRHSHTLVATFGNAPEQHTAQNAREFVAFCAPHWSCADGPDHPLKPLAHPWPDYFHGPDGVCGIHPEIDSAAVSSPPQNVFSERVLSLGPMTGAYNLMQKGGVEQLTVMGGAINVPGNETVYAETNIAFDPDAAHYIFAHCEGVETRVVPLDVTRQVFWTRDDVARIPEREASSAWIKKMLTAWFERYGGRRESVFHLHDPLAVYSMYAPDSFVWKRSGICVVTEGVERGRMSLCNSAPLCSVALGIDDSSTLSQKIFGILF